MTREGLDDNDRAILRELLQDAHYSLKQLSENTGLLAPSLSRRISRLRDIGVIQKFTLDLDYVRAGFGVTALILVRLKSIKEFEAHIKRMPNVVEAYALLGTQDYCLKVICETNFALMEITQDIMSIECVLDTQTSIVTLETKNEHAQLFR